jgi:hypothetical protein
MGMMKLFNDPTYEIDITFKTERNNITGMMKRSQYKRMISEYHSGNASGTYEIVIDKIRAEITFPIQEIDTIHIALEEAGA